MNQLALDAEAAAVLADALRSYLGDLHSEIAGTDNFDYREALKRREAILQGIAAQLGGAEAAPHP